MNNSFLPSSPDECLPCETPSDLAGRIARRAGVRGLLTVRTGETISAYSLDDPALSEGDIEGIKKAARATVLAALARNELASFVQCASSEQFYRVPAVYWSWWVAHNLTTGSSYPEAYETPSAGLVSDGDERFVGAPLMTAKRDGDSLVGMPPPVNENEQARASDLNGCPGRPTVLPFCEILMRERNAAGLSLENLTAEAHAIIEDFKVDLRYNHLSPCGPKTITNNLSGLHKQLIGKIDWPKREAE